MTSQPMVDKAKLEKVAGAGVSFTDAQVDDLIIQIKVCDEEWHEVYSPQFVSRYRKLKKLEKMAEELGAQLVASELNFGWDEPGLWRSYALGINANRIEEIWRAAGGKGKPGWTDKNKDDNWGGPVTELMLQLYEQAGIPPKRRPSRSAIRDGMKLWARVEANPNADSYRKRTAK